MAKCCSIEGCERKHYGRGYCKAHWYRWSRYGNALETALHQRPTGGKCAVISCERKHYGQGYCRPHWRRWKRWGDPLGQAPRSQRLSPRARLFWQRVHASGAVDDSHPIETMEEDAFGCWLAGLIDGEGCFSIPLGNAMASQTRSLSTRFQLLLRDDDVGVLVAAQRRTGIGAVYFHSRHGARYENGHSAVQWIITSRIDCDRLVEILDRYPLMSKKARDYGVWRRAVAAMHTERLEFRRDWTRVWELKTELDEARAYRSPEGV